MAAVTTTGQVGEHIGVGEHIHVPAWTLLMMGVVLLGAYVMLQENGWLMSNWSTIHEFFHDGRHAFGVPCH